MQTEIEKLQQADSELRLLRATKQSIVNGLLAEHTAKIRRELLIAQGAEKDAENALARATTPPEVHAAEANLTTRKNAVVDLQGQLKILES